MLSFKLAWKNLKGAGLRTWLNVAVLSISYVMIIWYQGLLDGWQQQARRDMIEWEIGGGQYWHSAYDPFDPFSLNTSHAPLPAPMDHLVRQKKIVPVLIARGSVYPQGRLQSVLIKGIPPAQTLLKLPTGKLQLHSDAIPAIIGQRFAKAAGLRTGDRVVLRWRDVHGTFDATDIEIAAVFHTNVPSVDVRQIWIPLKRLQTMLQLPEEATILINAQDIKPIRTAHFTYKDRSLLLKDIDEVIRRKSIGGFVMYLILLSLALLAVFDTQVLSIFRRQKEIGTLIALGMTQGAVVRLFTLEGAMHAVLAAALAAVYGIPLLIFQTVNGFSIPRAGQDFGLAIADKIYPVYGTGLVIGTVLVIWMAATIVSYFPARKISAMNPTEAIRGKVR